MADFYIDPDWTGTKSGTESQPWAKCDDSSAIWDVIDASLANEDVTLYFSAREASSDTNQTTTDRIEITRTDTSTHVLTLDGGSKYNTNDSSPSWSNYSGDSCFEVNSAGEHSLYTGWGTKRNYITIKNFVFVTESLGVANTHVIKYFAGDHVTIDNCDISHASSPSGKTGCGIYFEYEYYSTFPCTDLIIKNCTVHDVYGEGIYIGGVYETALTGHSDFTIEDNTVYNTGVGAGEADGIDIKDGNAGMVVRRNLIYQETGIEGHDGITTMSQANITQNHIYNFGLRGIVFGTYWNANQSCRDDSQCTHNLVHDIDGRGIMIGGADDGDDQWSNVLIANNTVYNTSEDEYGNGHGIWVSEYASNVIVKNNIVAMTADENFYAGGTCLSSHDNNCYYNTSGDIYDYGGITVAYDEDLSAQEAHSISSDPLFTDPDNADYTLATGSLCINAGADLGLTSDINGLPVPQGSGPDMGAYEFPPQGETSVGFTAVAPGATFAVA